MKKIVDVPEGAEEFLFEAYENDMLVGKTQEGYVSSLPDAPEKRVIELPADVIGLIKNVARNTMNVYEFLVEIENELPNVTNVGWNTLADWFLGHTKFVAKKEPNRYYLKFPGRKSYFAQEDENTWYRTLSIFYAVEFTDEGITEIADKFPELNFDALEKVKVED